MMKKIAMFSITGCATCLLVSAPLAMAHDRSGVNWSVSIGTSYPPPVIYTNPPPVIYVNPPPVVYVPAQPVYIPPHRAYVQPHPTYVLPQPVYVQPAPVLRYGDGYYDNRHNPRYGNHEQRQFQSHEPYRRHN